MTEKEETYADIENSHLEFVGWVKKTRKRFQYQLFANGGTATLCFLVGISQKYWIPQVILFVMGVLNILCVGRTANNLYNLEIARRMEQVTYDDAQMLRDICSDD